MADKSNAFKLFRTVDPSTVNVPIKDKFAKLTLSSNKKKQLASENIEKTNVSRQLLSELNERAHENPLLRSDSSVSSNSIKMGVEQKVPKTIQDESTQLDVSDYMEVLQLSGDGCTQRSEYVDVEQLSTQVSNLRVQPKEEVSICISSTTEEANDEEDDDNESCITISDSETEQDKQEEKQKEQEKPSMAISEQSAAIAVPSNKLQLLEAFLRDVSFERREMERRGIVDMSSDQLLHSRIASADTESMSQDIDITRLPTCSRPLDSSRLLADNETEANTVCSEEQQELEDPQPSCRRLANDETEDQSVADNTIPETSSEAEHSPVRSRTESASSVETARETERDLGTPAIQVSSINISAKINIKIHIPNIESSSAESESEDDEQPPEQPEEQPEEQAEENQQQRQQKDRSILQADASEDEEFLTNAEQLLNQLYGKSWQTPDVIRTLKRSSGSGGKTATRAAAVAATKASTVDRTPLTELRRQPKSRPAAATTAKKRQPAAKCNESALGDFSIFKRALHNNQLNSTHLPAATAAAKKVAGTRSARVANKQQVRTKHVHEERWRALVDTDSGTDASDDEDADATDCSVGSVGSGDNAGHMTYLDLTKAEVEVVSSPDGSSGDKSPKFPKKLDDILRTCRATVKPKMCATPSAPSTPSTPATPLNVDLPPTRRQLFTPNFGYEDENAAKAIVERALDMNNLDELEIFYQPGSTVHKRVQEVKRQLGIAVKSPKAKPIFKLPTTTTPQVTPSRTPSSRQPKQKQTPQVRGSGKCSFIKSLEKDVSREYADNEAYFYRENFKRNKEELTTRLYDMFNEKVFNNKLQVPIVWSKTLRNTAGRCRNKRKLNERMCVLELSIKVLTSADRLRCTLIHEMCHAATWIFNNEGGHGRTWKQWTYRAMAAFPDLPSISVCHDYDIEFKYTYRCEACDVGSKAHSRHRKVDNIRCRLCSGPIQLFLNKKDKEGNVQLQPVREAAGFAKFVKEQFKKHKRPDLTAAQVMRILSVEYAKQKEQHNKAATGAAAATDDLIANQVETLALDDDDDDEN
ncbi:germ cell nuclear acidic protein isoform X2 [Drosophila sulfurigaster albostrigata]|uniref:germ cell nuclear acidic protein isoform X2 n=1 Tax=Drosophila sulfurigaster albostrigata TaxID=89887 RepID=UPI002D21E2F9|nr:germ cell nuclear acidic protein isoform X2 [Drosophila sulfurigaster albostrigata]